MVGRIKKLVLYVWLCVIVTESCSGLLDSHHKNCSHEHSNNFDGHDSLPLVWRYRYKKNIVAATFVLFSFKTEKLNNNENSFRLLCSDRG